MSALARRGVRHAAPGDTAKVPVFRVTPDAAPITGSLRRLARDLAPPGAGDLAQRVRALGLDTLEVEPWEEIVDPAAGDQDDFDRCSDELRLLVAELFRRLA